VSWVRTIEVAHVRCTTDSDTPADLERLRQNHGVALEWGSRE
jgi:hypothetical protein